jgi:hypothetical protein
MEARIYFIVLTFTAKDLIQAVVVSDSQEQLERS